jgi:hypothetical protein
MSSVVWNRGRRAGGNARSKGRKAQNSRAVQWLGRFGDVCYGLVHLVVAWLAFQVAFGSSQQADQQGAVTAIAGQPFGSVLLWVLVVGLVAFAVWQALSAATGFQWIRPEGKRTRKRLGVAGRALAVLGIVVATIRLLVSGQSSSSDQKPQQLTGQLLALPAGKVLVAIAGLVVLVFAGVTAWRGIKRKFTEDWDTARLSKSARKTGELVGAVGFTAKGVAYAIIGVLTVYAAVSSDPAVTGGLDKALKTLAGQPFGTVLLCLVALGFIAFGGYLFVDAKARRG